MDKDTSKKRTNNRIGTKDKKPVVVCISGKAQSGKDTAASMMKACMEEKGHSVVIIHYADLLKFICTTYFGWNGKKDEDGRTLLQFIGTDVVRTRKPDFWVNFVSNLLDLFHEAWDYVIIPDTRFPNEIDRIQDAGYLVFHLKLRRPGFDNHLSQEQQKHISETALDSIYPNYIISNSGALSDLKKEVESITEVITRLGNIVQMGI